MECDGWVGGTKWEIVDRRVEEEVESVALALVNVAVVDSVSMSKEQPNFIIFHDQ